MLVLQEKVIYMLASPITTIKTDEVAELVVEFDSRIATKDLLGDLKDHPIPAVRRALVRSCPQKVADGCSLYGYRVNNKVAGSQGVTPPPYQIQCVLKLPKAHRDLALEASGRHATFIRDYLQNDADTHPSDTTVILRFWEHSPAGYHEASLTTQGIEGHAGLVITKRGIALRVWIKSIASARRALLPMDSRLCDDNISVVPRFQYVTSGWPTEAQALNVIQAIKAATGKALMPSRAWRGVRHWLVSFEERPTMTSFTLKVNDKETEILLTQQSNVPQSKGKGKRETQKFPQQWCSS